MYGAEIWACSWLASVLKGQQSPYTCHNLNQVVDFFRHYFGLPRNSFNAMVFKLLDFPSMLKLLLPRFMKFM